MSRECRLNLPTLTYQGEYSPFLAGGPEIRYRQKFLFNNELSLISNKLVDNEYLRAQALAYAVVAYIDRTRSY